MQLNQANYPKKFEQEFNVNNLDIFEEIVEENYGNKMVQNIIDLVEITNDESKSITIVPREKI